MKNDRFFEKWARFGGKLYHYSNGRWTESSEHWFKWELARQAEQQKKQAQYFVADLIFAVSVIGAIVFLVFFK